jgi:DNA primase
MEGAKDPDEFVIKYGNARFEALIDKALSVIEFKVKVLKNSLNLEATNDKIKFLNEIAKLIAKVDNTMEREVYIEKIAKEYDISKEAIYAEVTKPTYSGNKGEKILDKAKPVIKHVKIERNQVPEAIKKRENTILSILLMGDINIFQIIKQNIKVEDFKDELNSTIAKKLYEEFEKGNSNINGILDNLSEEEQNHITMIMAEDYGIEDVEKAIDDIMRAYEKERLTERKFEILELIDTDISEEQKKLLGKELSDIMIRLAKIK